MKKSTSIITILFALILGVCIGRFTNEHNEAPKTVEAASITATETEQPEIVKNVEPVEVVNAVKSVEVEKNQTVEVKPVNENQNEVKTENVEPVEVENIVDNIEPVEYSRNTVVIGVTDNVITVIDYNGVCRTFEDDSNDWNVNDFCVVTYEQNENEADIYSDTIARAEYSGYLKGDFGYNANEDGEPVWSSEYNVLDEEMNAEEAESMENIAPENIIEENA